MGMENDLHSAGIQLNSYSVGNHYAICPRCSHTRKAGNQTKKCLSVTIDADGSAVWLCHNCDWKGGGGKVYKKPQHDLKAVKSKTYKKPELPKEKYTTKFPQHVLDYFASRKISQAVVEKNRISYEPRADGICFPFFEGETPVNIKHRPLKEKKFWLEPEAKIPFYGLDVHFYKAFNESKEIIIVEGEFDKLAMNECGFWNTLSVPHGAPQKEITEADAKKFDYLIHAEDLIKQARKIVLCVDNDAAGKILEKELLRRFGPERCYLMELPAKDANDTLKQFGSDILCDCYQEAKPHPINGLFTVDEFEDSLLGFFNQDMQAGAKTGWENVDTRYTVMPGRLTVVTGVPYSGKSEWLDALTINLAKSDNQRFAIFSPEHSKEEHVTKLIEKVTEKPASHDAKDRMSVEEFKEAARWVGANYFFLVSDDASDLPTIDWILAKADAAIMRYGITGLIIDPYNEIEHKRPGAMTESEYISQLLSKIKRFAKARQIHIWIVAHPAKQTKDKDGNIQVPGGYDISGSANWLNKADNLIVVHRGEAANMTQIHIKKVKPKYAGKQGLCHLVYNRNTGLYSVPDSETDQDFAEAKTQRKTTESRYYDSVHDDDTIEVYR